MQTVFFLQRYAFEQILVITFPTFIIFLYEAASLLFQLLKVNRELNLSSDR